MRGALHNMIPEILGGVAIVKTWLLLIFKGKMFNFCFSSYCFLGNRWHVRFRNGNINPGRSKGQPDWVVAGLKTRKVGSKPCGLDKCGPCATFQTTKWTRTMDSCQLITWNSKICVKETLKRAIAFVTVVDRDTQNVLKAKRYQRLNRREKNIR